MEPTVNNKLASRETTFPSIPAIDTLEIEKRTPPKFYAVRSEQLAKRISLRTKEKVKDNFQSTQSVRKESQSSEFTPDSPSPMNTTPDRLDINIDDASNEVSRPQSQTINSIFVPSNLGFPSGRVTAKVVDPVPEYLLRNRSVYNRSHEFSKADEDKILKEDDLEVIEFDDSQDSENILVIDPVGIDIHPAQDSLKQEIQNEQFSNELTPNNDENAVFLQISTASRPIITFGVASETRAITFEIVELQACTTVIDHSQIMFEEPYIICHEIEPETIVKRIVTGNPESATKRLSEDRRRHYRNQLTNELHTYLGGFVFITRFCLLMKYIFNLVYKPREGHKQSPNKETEPNNSVDQSIVLDSTIGEHNAMTPTKLKALNETQACSKASETTLHVVQGGNGKEILPYSAYLPSFSMPQFMGTTRELVNGNPVILFGNSVDGVSKQLPPPYSYKIPQKRKPPDKIGCNESSLA